MTNAMHLLALPLAASPELSHFAMSGMFGLWSVWAVLAGAATVLVHLAFAWAVLVDTDVMWRTERRKPIFASAGLWALATLLGGVMVAGVYWVMHRSSLRPPPGTP